MKNYNFYQSPLQDRYFCNDMSTLFSKEQKIKTWRKLWIELAKAQKELGVSITNEQIEELEKYENKIEIEDAEAIESKIHHEVMSHIHNYANQCPKAAPIIHLGATSAFILDNTDLILMKSAMGIIESKLIQIIEQLKSLSLRYKDLTCLSYTHYQVAQPSTLGKRFSLWLQDFLYDYQQLIYQKENIPFRGAKGTTGTQDSFLKLFNGNKDKIFQLDKILGQKFNFNEVCYVTGQTYSRKIDFYVLNILSGIAQSAHKLTNDFRLLNHSKALEESFEEKQVGSSAMPYKKNPILAERISGLSRYLILQIQNASFNHSLQWLERTLDDSSNRRLLIPESFLLMSYILNILLKLLKTAVINESIIKKEYQNHLAFLVTEEILLKSVLKGGNRQDLHESIRQASLKTYQKVLHENGNNSDLFDILGQDSKIPFNKEELKNLAEKAKLTGIANHQVVKFIKDKVDPILNKKSKLG